MDKLVEACGEHLPKKKSFDNGPNVHQLPKMCSEHKEPQSAYQVALPAIAYLGSQLAWAVLIGYTTPMLRNLGLSDLHVGYAWLLAPISALIVQPFVGYASDNCKLSIGRRRPFVAAGALMVITGLLFFGFSEEIGYGLGDDEFTRVHQSGLVVAISAFALMDFGIQFVQCPLRALLADRTPANQHAQGNAYFAVANGIGKCIGFTLGWMVKDVAVLCAVAALLMAVTNVFVLVAATETPLQRVFTNRTGNFFSSVLDVPAIIIFVFVVQALSYVAWMCVFTYASDWMGKEVYGGDASQPLTTQERASFSNGVREANLGLALMALLSAVLGMVLPPIIDAVGVYGPWCLCLCVLSANLLATPLVNGNVAGAVCLLAFLGIPLAATQTIPWAIVTVTLADDKNKGLFIALFHFSHAVPELLVSSLGGLVIHSFDEQLSAMLVLGGFSAAVAVTCVLAAIVHRHCCAGGKEK